MQNVYEDAQRAEAYAKLEFPGTYYLAYRDLPQIIRTHVTGNLALDFGCGAGRSTRFLRQQGFHVTGVDISQDMLSKARAIDPQGDYRLIDSDGLRTLEAHSFDLVLCAFPFDNIPTSEKKVRLLSDLCRLLSQSAGKIINLVSAPEIYKHEWASFTTKDYPENRNARSGDIVRIIVTDLEDRRPVEDIYWTDESYQETYSQAGLKIAATYRPLGRPEEPYTWVNETRIAPWVIYVLEAK